MEKLKNNIFMNIRLLIIADEIQDLLLQLQQHGSVPEKKKIMNNFNFQSIWTEWIENSESIFKFVI